MSPRGSSSQGSACRHPHPAQRPWPRVAEVTEGQGLAGSRCLCREAAPEEAPRGLAGRLAPASASTEGTCGVAGSMWSNYVQCLAVRQKTRPAQSQRQQKPGSNRVGP